MATAKKYVVKINFAIPFYFYKNGKDLITLLRCWLIAFCLDYNAKGYVDTQSLVKHARISKKYLKSMLSRKNEFFRSVTNDRVYLKSLYIISKNNKIGWIRRNREEITNKKFFEQLQSKKAFEGYLCKCYMEMDLRERKPKNLTRGRISYEMLAKEFKISRRTAISNIKISTAKIFPNILHFKNTRFRNKKEFSNWLLNNIGRKLQGYVVKGDLSGYRLTRDETGYYLTRVLPNIYKYTGCNHKKTK
jgi:hypothetical protein